MASPHGPLCTLPFLTTHLRKLIHPNDTVLLHSSLRSIGWIPGQAETVVAAILDILTPQGTLVVPTHTGDNSDPAKWENPPVPESWWQDIRDTMPAYNPRTSKTRAMGAVAEMVRTWPGAVRSDHPQTSFAAVGARAEYITSGHAYDCMMGEKSPLARLEECGAKVLLLGVGFDVCTCFHLAEYRVSSKMGDNSFAAIVDGERAWVTVKDVIVEGDDFGDMGREMELEIPVTEGKVGAADCKVFSLPDAVKFAEKWIAIHRN
ncbi:aminoglycoside acetyltransferase [Pochonia chlamydosporia 170]|uniref:Aminoglycoside acetyltransferase n=1 Tax=Pochonia chlamydosporia 170 TaxID=1380566 RepID=A0A179FMH9_METCM|nr:aminoglycoside acetyltransferase [Pochonia chlamydosporia 170]OAQ66229.1 aminoglycoside acetyltransferase [Pochonia chlamydosporia 170]